MKIAVRLNDGNSVNEVAEYPSSLYQDKNKGWITVEDDPAFSIADKFNWTIRKPDNVLVHKSTNMTPTEETKQAIALLGTTGGQALADSASAKSTANEASTIASGAVESMAQLGKVIAPLLAAQNSTTQTDGGTK